MEKTNNIEKTLKSFESKQKELEVEITKLEENELIKNYLELKSNLQEINTKIANHCEYEGKYLKIVFNNDINDRMFYFHCSKTSDSAFEGDIIVRYAKEDVFADIGLLPTHQDGVPYYHPNGALYKVTAYAKSIEEISKDEFDKQKEEFKYKLDSDEYTFGDEIYYVKDEFKNYNKKWRM